MGDSDPTRRHRVLHLDDIEALPGPATLTWRPVRATLGLRAFGTNAYTADDAGVDVVEPHTESPKLAQEELYFVHRGRARFTIDGEEFEAPAGTYVFVPDPASHRHAVATEAGTTVLSFGGPPTFEPSAWEWTFRASAQRQAGHRGAPRRTLHEALHVHPESAAVRYELACLAATGGEVDEALDRLAEAIELDAGVAGYALTNADLEALRSDDRF